MWTSRQSEILTPVAPYTQPAANVASAQVMEWRVRPSRFRLEGLLLTVNMTLNAAVVTNCEGLLGLIEKVEVFLNDGTGNGTRANISASGPALVEFARNNGWKLDPFTAYASVDTLTAVTALTYPVTIPILFRHPLLQEPKAMLTSIPLYGPTIQEDIVIKVTFRASTAISATATPFTSVYPYMLAMYRQPSAAPGLDLYIPTEFREEVFFPAATGEQRYNIPAGGFLSSVLLRNHTTNAYSAAQASAGLVNASAVGAMPEQFAQKFQLKVGKNIRQEFNEGFLLALNCATDPNRLRTDLTATSGRDVAAPSYFIDLLADFASSDASSVLTALNLNPVQRGGDDVAIVFSSWLSANYAARIACHKFLPRNDSDLVQLAFGV